MSSSAATGLAALAGCVAGGSDAGSGGSDADDGAATRTTSTPTDTPSPTDPPTPTPVDVDDWLAGVDAYRGEIVDRTGSAAVTIGTGETVRGAPSSFDPPAVRVSTGTTVSWEWSGEGPHELVVFEAKSEGVRGRSDVETAAGVGYEYTFESAGTYRYACEPHRALNGRGAVVAE